MTVLDVLAPQKDVDGFGPHSAGALFTGVARVVDGPGVFGKRDTDRIRTNARNSTLTVHRKAVPLSQCFHRSINRG